MSFFIILFVALLDWMGVGLVYPMFSSMLFQDGSLMVPEDTSDAVRGLYLGVLLAAMPLTQFFCSPVLGFLSDRRGRKPLIALCLAVGVAGYLLSWGAVTHHSLLLLFLSRVLIGVSGGSAAVVSAAIADLSAPEAKAKHFGLYNMTLGVGLAIGPFLGGKLSAGGFALPFLCAGALTLLNLLFVLLFLKETRAGSVEGQLSHGLANLRCAYRNRSLRAVFAAVFFFSFGWSFFYEFIPVTWITAYQFTPPMIGTLYAFGAACYAISCGWIIRPIMNRWNAYAVLTAALGITGCYMLSLLWHTDPRWTWVYLALLNALVSLLFPTASALVSNAASPAVQGQMLGLLQSVYALAFALSPLTSGSLLGLHAKIPILVGGISMLAAAAALIRKGRAYDPV
jgi:DHA1 family tetracycline resistance protein-like MFS transporter